MSGERRIVAGALVLAALALAWTAATASAGHGLARGTGAAALTLLLVSLAMSPIARVVRPAWAVACRSARRTIGIASASVALGHAALALYGYVVPLALGPIFVVPWLRHGALALAVLVALLLTSFPAIQRALRVRAWSALHRLVYVAAILGSLHALGVPFGSAWLGLGALALTALALVARPLTALVRRRSRPEPE